MTDLSKGRPATFFFVVGAGVASAIFNVWGAYTLYIGVAGFLFAAGIFFCEGVALLSLKSIVEDWDKGQKIKAGVAALIFVVAVAGCAISGKRTFDNLAVDMRTTKTQELARADRIQSVADEHFSNAAKTNNYSIQRQELARAEKEQARADAIRKTQEKAKPPAEWVTWLLLALFEAVKAFGRWALATKQRRRPQLGKPRLAVSNAA